MNYLELQQLKELVVKLVNNRTKYDQEDVMSKIVEKITETMAIIVYRNLIEKGGRQIEHILISALEKELLNIPTLKTKYGQVIRLAEFRNKIDFLKSKKIFNY